MGSGAWTRSTRRSFVRFRTLRAERAYTGFTLSILREAVATPRTLPVIGRFAILNPRVHFDNEEGRVRSSSRRGSGSPPGGHAVRGTITNQENSRIMQRNNLRFALGALLFAGVTAVDAAAQCPAADAFEPNDDCLSATPVTPGSYANLTLEGPLNGENQDFYSISVPAGEIITVDLTFATATGDIDLYLYDTTTPNCGGTATGDYLIRGFTGSDNEQVSWTNSTGAAETYTIMVDAWDSDSDFGCNDYSMDITVAPDPCTTAVDDGLEENDTCGAAVALAGGSTTSLFTSTTDEDYYTINVPAAQILTVDVSYASGVNADIDLELFDDLACTNQVDFSFSTGGTGQVTWTNTTGATATLVMRAAPDAATGSCNNYDLNVALAFDPCQTGTDDALEDNDSCATAAGLGAGAHAGLFTSTADEDYYLVTVPAGEILTVDVTYISGVNADVDLELFDDLACTNQVDFSFSFGGTGTVEWVNATGAAATVVLRVAPDAATGDCNDYDLNIASAPDPCLDPLADDGFEDNDDCASAVSMADGTYTGLFTVDNDEDYYEVTLADGDTLNVDILFTDANGDLDLVLYESLADCNLDVDAASSTGVVDNESVSYTNTTGSTLTMIIRVYHWTGDSASDCNTYDMIIDGSGGSAATPFCAGDGSAGACPCANESAVGAGEGCNSSLGFGAILTAAGSASVANDDMVFTLSQARPNQPSLLVQGSVAVALPFKDGLLCMGNPTERLEVVFLDGTGTGSTTVSIVTEGNVSVGQTRYYQQWFRDPGGVSPCGSGSNFSGGLIVNWM